MEGRRRRKRPAPWLRLSARRLAVVNTFSLVSLQMNTAIEATYNINVACWCLTCTNGTTPQQPSHFHLDMYIYIYIVYIIYIYRLSLSLGFASIQNGHINLIISLVIRLADEERLRDGRRLPLHIQGGVASVPLTPRLSYATRQKALSFLLFVVYVLEYIYI